MRQLFVSQPSHLLAYLLATSGQKRGAVKNLLKSGAISVNGASTRQFDHPLSPGDVVTIGDPHAAVAATRLERAKIRIIYEDEALFVLDKPAGLPTVTTLRDKTDTLAFRLNAYLQDAATRGPRRAIPVHRLDQPTSGLVMFARDAAIRQFLQDRWDSVEKRYWAVVEGRPRQDEGVIHRYLTEMKSLLVRATDEPQAGSRSATTHYRVVETRDDWSLVRVRLETGRKHQIRAHLASIGCPIVGDPRYGAKTDPCGRLGLHSAALGFDHPTSGGRLRFTSPLPPPLARLFSRGVDTIEDV